MLFASAKAADKEKFEILYVRFKNLMLSKAFDILKDYELAQDAVSEAFIRVYKNLHKLEDLDSGKTPAFLVMITKNVSLTMLNKHKKENTVDIADIEAVDSLDLENEIIAKNSEKELLTLIGSLKEELKTPFLLKFAYDFSLKEISKILKITENNAAVRIHRAKTKLAKMLKEGGCLDEI